MSDESRPLDYATPATGATGFARWIVCGLLFFATTINYIDRFVIGLLKGTITEQLHWKPADADHNYANIINSFQIAYALGYLIAGRWIDVIGVRFGLAIAVAAWSTAATAHGLANGVIGFAVARAALGLSEGANFPAAMKSVGEWFPKKERALAFGILNSGSNIGSIIAPAVVLPLTIALGWKAAFVITGLFGFFWLGLWLWLYQKPEDQPRLSRAELTHIRSDPPDPPGQVPWLTLLQNRGTWAVIVGMTLTNPVWWFYLFWVPGYLATSKSLDLKSLPLPIMTIYMMASIGSIAGGWLSSRLIKSGWSVNAARKTTLLICALCVVPASSVTSIHGLWPAVIVIGLAAAAHQGWSANLYTLASDIMPKSAVASVVGISCMPGAILSMFYSDLTADVVTKTHSYFVPFALASGAYLAALGLMQILLPEIRMTVNAGLSEYGLRGELGR